MDYFRGLIGVAILIGIAWAFSINRKSVNWRLVGGGLVIHLLLGLLIIKVQIISTVFSWLSGTFVKVLSFSEVGVGFILGKLAHNPDWGFIFAFHVLPSIVFFAALSGLLYHIGLLQLVVSFIARCFSKAMHLSGAESFSMAGNIFLGQTEAPLLVKPFIPKMTQSELMCLMTGGMATISGSVFAGYVAFLGGDDIAERTRVATYLLSASFMNAPAAIIMAKILYPETEGHLVEQKIEVKDDNRAANFIDAIARGTGDGINMVLKIGGMLLVFISLIAMLNYFLEFLGGFTGVNEMVASMTGGVYQSLSMEFLLGQCFRLVAVVIGVSWEDSLQVGSLLGQKLVLNEFIAYTSLAEIKANLAMSDRSIIISTYALCGFANFGSIAIQIGGIGSLVPEQQKNLSKLGFRALTAATLATLVTANTAGLLLG
ncbi:MAG: nucleoside transporter C-terminal domain-containing protein [Opitutales bacterium]|jgi:CNT family concentrative nucleoside transporter|nr:Na+ dependent nucleoside transporter [Opitutales bacterium]MDB2499536.1 NupC/NupG family nucleoside CNT transporter [bacterium]MDG2168133.1 nucleoside transporter C-terminal domain-containing protein [Opitutales bacterium]